MTRGLLRLLSSVLQAEQGGLACRDVHCGPQPRSRSTGQTVKDRKSRGRRKKSHSCAEASLFLAAPRKPSFPFQWAWEGQTSLRPGPSPPSLHVPPVPFETPQRLSRHKAMTKLPEAPDSGWGFKTSTPDRKQLAVLGRHPDPAAPSQAEGQGLEPPSKKAGPTWGPEEGSELEGLDAERAPSPRELPQLPRKGPAAEGESAEIPEEAERGRGSSINCRHLQGPQQRRARARELDRLWQVEKLQRDLSRGSEKQSRKALQALNGPNQMAKGQASGDRATSLYINFQNRTFHKRQEATRSLLKTREQHQRQEQQQEEQRRARELRVQQQVARCLAAYGPRGSQGSGPTVHKLEELRRQERQRFTEYQAELQDIHIRVQARPYLFQQAMQTNARLSVNRRFSQVLSALGLDEKQLLAEAGKRDLEGTARNPRRHRSAKVKLEHSQSTPRPEASSRRSAPSPESSP